MTHPRHILAVTALLAGVGGAVPGTLFVDHFDLRVQTITGRKYELLRMHLDLTGDGEPELLLASGPNSLVVTFAKPGWLA